MSFTEKFCIQVNENAFFYLKPFPLKWELDLKTNCYALSQRNASKLWFIFLTCMYLLHAILSGYVVILQAISNKSLACNFTHGKFAIYVYIIILCINCAYTAMFLWNKTFLGGFNHLIQLKQKLYKGRFVSNSKL